MRSSGAFQATRRSLETAAIVSNGVGEVSLLSLEDMVRLAIDTIPAARDALALQLNSRFEGNVSGKPQQIFVVLKLVPLIFQY